MNPENGFILIDKPAGITSFGVVARLRKVTGIKKIGHAGTLDPFATGLLIVAIGREATKQIDSFLKRDKTYTATFVLGETTASLDPETPTEVDAGFDPAAITLEKLKNAAATQTGTITQIPPIYSAIKINGERAYKMARAGEAVEMKARPATIHEFDILSFETVGQTVEVKVIVDCASGTYIRSLARDMAAELGTLGYVTELCRLTIGEHSVSAALKLGDVGPDWTKHLLIAKLEA